MPTYLRPWTGLFSPIRVPWPSRPRCALLFSPGSCCSPRAQAACGGPAVLSGSCFEGGDGNLTADGGLTNPDNTDWATTSDETLLERPDLARARRSATAATSRTPPAGALAGEPSTNKLDITAAATRLERIGSDIWMHVGFTMRGAAGSSNVLSSSTAPRPRPAPTRPGPQRRRRPDPVQRQRRHGLAHRPLPLGRQPVRPGPGRQPDLRLVHTPLPGSLITSSNKDCTQVSGGGNPLAIGQVNSGTVLNNLQDETQSVARQRRRRARFTLDLQRRRRSRSPATRAPPRSRARSRALSNIAVGDVAVTGSQRRPVHGPLHRRVRVDRRRQMTAAARRRSRLARLDARPGRRRSLLPARSPPFASPTIAADLFGECRSTSRRRSARQRLEPCFELRQRLAAHLQRQLDLVDHGRLRRAEAGHRRRLVRGLGRQEGRGQPELARPRRPIRRPTTRARRPTRAPRMVGDYLWYRLAVTNTGTAALTPNVTDANCDLAALADADRQRRSPAARPTRRRELRRRRRLDHLCKHQLAAGDPEPTSTPSRRPAPAAASRRRRSRTPRARAATARSSSRRTSPARSAPSDRVDLLVGGSVKAAAVGDGGATPATVARGGASATLRRELLVRLGEQLQLERRVRRHEGHRRHRRRHRRQLDVQQRPLRQHHRPGTQGDPLHDHQRAQDRARSRSSRTSIRTPTPGASTSASTAQTQASPAARRTSATATPRRP